MNRKHCVVQYVRKNGKPFGAIVAVKSEDGFRIGYSLCNKKDRFKKETGLKIAFGRADTWNLLPYKIPNEIMSVLPLFIQRCRKYYRTANAPSIESVPF